MNQHLCAPNNVSTTISTAYEFSAIVSHISLYVLPVLALAGNSLTLLVFLTNNQLNQSSFSVYIKSMAVSDTLVLIFKLLSYINKKSKYIYSPSLCTFLIFCGETSALLSIWIIVIITIERTLVVTFPLHKKKLVSPCQARVLVLLTTILMMIFCSRGLLIRVDTSKNQTKRCQPLDEWQSYKKINATITEFGYCYIPLAIVIIGNCLTWHKVKRAIFQRRYVLTNNSDPKTKRTTDCNENQLMIMLLLVTLMFIVYFVPYTITSAIARWGLPFRKCFTARAFQIYALLRLLSELLKDLNFCTNFIIYCISGRRFRHALWASIKGQMNRSRSMSRSFESSRQLNDRLFRQDHQRKSTAVCARPTIEESQF